MKKIIIVIAIAFLGCNKNDTPVSIQDNGSIKFNSTVYSGVLNQSNFTGVGMFSNPTTTTTTGYAITGGNGTLDNLIIQFRVNGTLTTGTIATVSPYTLVGYTKGDSVYVGDGTYGTTISINVSDYSNKVLNGTFTATLKTAKGTSINITNGQFINVPTNN